MSKHTPGPWIAKPDPSTGASLEDWVVGTADAIDEVAVCYRRDAHLIAAAPEMLEALEGAVEALDSDNPDIQLRAAVAARAAMAKAKGGA